MGASHILHVSISVDNYCPPLTENKNKKSNLRDYKYPPIGLSVEQSILKPNFVTANKICTLSLFFSSFLFFPLKPKLGIKSVEKILIDSYVIKK